MFRQQMVRRLDLERLERVVFTNIRFQKGLDRLSGIAQGICNDKWPLVSKNSQATLGSTGLQHTVNTREHLIGISEEVLPKGIHHLQNRPYYVFIKHALCKGVSLRVPLHPGFQIRDILLVAFLFRRHSICGNALVAIIWRKRKHLLMNHLTQENVPYPELKEFGSMLTFCAAKRV